MVVDGAAGDSPREFPELVMRAPQGAEGFKFCAQAFLSVADSDVDHVVGRPGAARAAAPGYPCGFGDDQLYRRVTPAQGLVVAVAYADEALAEAFGELAGAVLAGAKGKTRFHPCETASCGAG